MLLNFAKYEGLGNDFIIIKNLDGSIALTVEQIALLCDRNFGIGADGLIFARPSVNADFFMDYYNSDGSLAEMCGNGIRCYAKYLVDEWLTDKSTLIIETRAGHKQVELILDGGKAIGAKVDMGAPELETLKIPVRVEVERAIDEQFTFGDTIIRATCVSMGNPHCVIFVDDVKEAPVQTLGPVIETSDYFPQKTNVEFAQIISKDEIALRVWERGCGETLACGTGACATLVAAALNDRTGRFAVVHLLGGDLSVTWNDDNRILMEGPAKKVFTGTIDIK
ncbi:MAG: diaminopimelate epimerase [Actinomycetota bacterium]|nr:diaminopimelate epimerase [Actinomycetota bacterium]